MQSWGDVAYSFTLENDEGQLRIYFPSIERRRYEDSLKVTEAAPLVEYVLSGWASNLIINEEEFTKFVEYELIKCGGEFLISKDSGIFIAVQD
jgi:hypothetical protein